MLCRQFCSLYWLQEPAALAAMQAAMKAKPIEEFGPPSAELWSAVLVRRLVLQWTWRRLSAGYFSRLWIKAKIMILFFV